MQFGINVRAVDSGQDFRRLVERADELGCDVFAAPDHLGGMAPFAVLAAAGAISSRLRLRTYVLNVGFWNPALLAREVAMVDLLSGGRVELGLGAGHMKSEYDDAGLPWSGHRQRVEQMERTIEEVRRRLAAEDHRPPPVQRPIPLVIGAMSRAGLSVAARHADIVAFAAVKQLPGASPGTLTVSSSAEMTEAVRQVTEEAGGRPYHSDVLLQRIVLGRDPAGAAAELAATMRNLSADQLLDTPAMLLARDAKHAADILRERQARYGFDSVITHQPNLEALGEVIAAYQA